MKSVGGEECRVGRLQLGFELTHEADGHEEGEGVERFQWMQAGIRVEGRFTNRHVRRRQKYALGSGPNRELSSVPDPWIVKRHQTTISGSSVPVPERG